VVIRIDGAGATHELLGWLVARRLSYSVGFTLSTEAAKLIAKIPDHLWTPASDADGRIRDGAWVANSPTCSTSRAGPTACGSSSVRNARIPAPNCV
jgi:Transposase DDE domain group 1